MQFKNIDINKIKFCTFKYSNSKQKMLCPKIDNKQVVFKTPWIELNQYGIQKLNDFYPDDNKRNFIKIPHNDKNFLFTDFLHNLDIYMESIHGDILPVGSNLNYIPLVKNPSNEKYKKFTKLNFMVDYNTKLFKTTFFINKEKQDIKNINDLEDLHLYMKKVRFIIRISKCWYNNTMYGVKLVVEQMEIEPDERINHTNNFNEYAFYD